MSCAKAFFALSENVTILCRTLTIIALLLIVVGSGSTRSNLTTFAGNQYNLPEDKKQLALFFTLNIFAIKLGSFSGRLTNPIVKEDVKCFGMEDCYPLAFLTAAIATAAGVVLLLIGKSSFTHKPPSGNMLIKVIKCMIVSIKYISSIPFYQT